MKTRSKVWIAGFFTLVIGTLALVGWTVFQVDPFFHYHEPHTDKYFYRLNNQRSQNDGIIKHFEYDALITGTSMTENFQTSDMDSIFGTKSIKVSYSGGSYKEINDMLRTALSENSELKTIVRSIDMDYFLKDKDAMRQDLGDYPTYLYDDLWYNDVKYLFNRNVIFERVYPMMSERKKEWFKPGITSFDEYSYWGSKYEYGIKTVCPNGLSEPWRAEPVSLSEEDRETVLDNVRQNITSLTEDYPDVTFYYFFAPYSIVSWRDWMNNGVIYRQLEAERIIIEEILKCDNIKLYSFNNLTNITTDLNHYKDKTHYGPWINTLMLQYMKDETCLLTYENYEQYLDEERTFYTTYDYTLVNAQTDYEDDHYAEVLLGDEMPAGDSLDVLAALRDTMELSQAKIVSNQYNGQLGLECVGSLQRPVKSELSIPEYMIQKEYVGAKFTLEDIGRYQYLTFYGIKKQYHGQPFVAIYDQYQRVVSQYRKHYRDLDNEWQQYTMDVSKLSGPVTIVLNGGYVDDTGNLNSTFIFSNIILS